MKNWLLSIVPIIIIVFLFANFNSILGLLHTWVVLLFVIVALGSYYVPYKLVEGENRSSIYAVLFCVVTLASAYKFTQFHKSGLNVYKQEICGMVENRIENGRSYGSARRGSRLHQFDLRTDTGSIEHFSKNRDVPWNGQKICVEYIDRKHSWLYEEHMILGIRSLGFDFQNSYLSKP